jgi:hypothetical protein
MNDRAELAYSIYRGGFSDAAKMPPHWSELPSWIRDAITVAYLQGKTDAR